MIEAYAAGTPVIASRLGAMAELVADGATGTNAPGVQWVHGSNIGIAESSDKRNRGTG